MKIIIKNREYDCYVYFITRKDNDDFDSLISNLSMTDLFDDEGEPISDDTKNMVKSIQPESWNPNLFIELFNKVAPHGYKATLNF